MSLLYVFQSTDLVGLPDTIKFWKTLKSLLKSLNLPEGSEILCAVT